MENVGYRLIVLTAAIAVNVFALPARAETKPPHGWKTTVLVEGAPMKGGSNGLAFDSTDTLYVANVFGRTIRRLIPTPERYWISSASRRA
jgi:hypothetical protein